MRILHNICGFLLAVAGIVAGVFVLRETLAGGAGLAVLGERFAAVPAMRATGVGILLFATGGLYLLTGLFHGRSRLLAFDNEGGTVSINTDAICDFVAKLAPEFPSIVRLVPDVKVGRGKVDIRVRVRMQAGPQMHETCELLQQRVRERLITGLGISQVRKIEVKVTDIVGGNTAT